MTAHLVIMSERTTNPGELERYRERRRSPAKGALVRPVAFDGAPEALRGAKFAGGEGWRWPAVETQRSLAP